MTTNATLCFIIKDGQILLQQKTEGRFGAGKWNAPGGKVNPGETPLDAAAREVEEETGLKVSDLKPHGVLRHHFEENTSWQVYIYSTNTYHGTPTPNQEGELKWFNTDSIPYNQMWQDDQHWLPLLLADRQFTGEFYFNKDGGKLLGHQLVVITKEKDEDPDEYED